MKELTDRITNYLANGGLFNPEAMPLEVPPLGAFREAERVLAALSPTSGEPSA